MTEDLLDHLAEHMHVLSTASLSSSCQHCIHSHSCSCHHRCCHCCCRCHPWRWHQSLHCCCYLGHRCCESVVVVVVVVIPVVSRDCPLCCHHHCPLPKVPLPLPLPWPYSLPLLLPHGQRQCRVSP
jgi:hypothetical protein